MIEQPMRFRTIGMETEIIRHNQYNINIIWIGLGRDITPKDYQTRQFACGTRKLIDTPETGRDGLALRRAAPKL
jgi:hypothetical protein